MKLTAGDLVGLLANRHHADVFVPECKTGPTPCLRMDAWAMKRSWANPQTWAYEVKVSRSDFTGDDKWQLYLDYAAEFYFVCPHGLIGRDELPAEAGLIYATKNGTQLRKVKAAPRRTVTVPEELWRYLLMSRSRLVANMWETAAAETEGEALLAWAEGRRKWHQAGRFIAKRLRERLDRLEAENDEMRREAERAERVEKRLEQLGLGNASPWDLDRRMNELAAAIPPDLDEKLEQAAARCNLARAGLRDLVRRRDQEPAT